MTVYRIKSINHRTRRTTTLEYGITDSSALDKKLNEFYRLFSDLGLTCHVEWGSLIYLTTIRVEGLFTIYCEAQDR